MNHQWFYFNDDQAWSIPTLESIYEREEYTILIIGYCASLNKFIHQNNIDGDENTVIWISNIRLYDCLLNQLPKPKVFPNFFIDMQEILCIQNHKRMQSTLLENEHYFKKKKKDWDETYSRIKSKLPSPLIAGSTTLQHENQPTTQKLPHSH